MSLSNYYTDIRLNERIYASAFNKEARWNILIAMTDFKAFPPHWVMVF